jgi:formamidopyrimidine-DNA glycosylase
MPELAEVEVARRHIERWWKGQRASAVKLAAPNFLRAGSPERLEALLTKHPLSALERRGKHLIASFEGDDARLLLHFKLTGKITRGEVPKARDLRMAWHLPDTGWLRFQDARRLGEAHLLEADEFAQYAPLLNMGPEPHDLADGEALGARLGNGKGRLKDRLLDQTVIAGVGNIAISELFWRLKLVPDMRVDQLTADQRDALVAEMPVYFDWLIATSEHIEDFVYLSEGAEDNPFSAYDREGLPCLRCETPIERLTFGGRSTYWCPACQVAAEVEEPADLAADG